MKKTKTLALLLAVFLLIFVGCSNAAKDKTAGQAAAEKEAAEETAAEDAAKEEAPAEDAAAKEEAPAEDAAAKEEAPAEDAAAQEEAATEAAEDETATDNEYEVVGIEMDLSEMIENSKGLIVPNPIGLFDDDHDIYVMTINYVGMPKEEAAAVLYNSDSTTEELKKVYEKQVPLHIIIASDIDYDATVKSVSERLGIDYSEQMALAEVIGTADGFTFYSVPERQEERFSNLDKEYAEEFENLRKELLEKEKSARLFAPYDPLREVIGQKLEFTTTDLDGNTVTSQELFSANEITMVNCWGLWCGNCMGEMAELGEIHKRFQEKGCGILGLEYEGTMTDELAQQSKDMFNEKGITFPNVQLPEELLDQMMGYPTTFYVDKEGTILCMPIVGAAVNKYESILDNLLSGKEVTDTMADDVANTVSESQDILYNVYVTDENGPVEGVTIQFCSDSCCKMGKTDENGVTSFSMPVGDVYDIHVLRVPEGYEKDPTLYHTTDGSNEVRIQLKKQ